jgi:hypothetical protein
VLRPPIESAQYTAWAFGRRLRQAGSVKWLTRYFEIRTLNPFALYSLLAGTICIIRFA